MESEKDPAWLIEERKEKERRQNLNEIALEIIKIFDGLAFDHIKEILEYVDYHLNHSVFHSLYHDKT